MRGSVVKLIRPGSFVARMLLGSYQPAASKYGRDRYRAYLPERNRVRHAKRLWKLLPHTKRGRLRQIAHEYTQLTLAKETHP